MTLTGLRFFFFNDTATTEIYTLSLHDALPILSNFLKTLVIGAASGAAAAYFLSTEKGKVLKARAQRAYEAYRQKDRKSTRLNSSHANISYAVFCLKKKKDCTSHLPTPGPLSDH